MRPSTVLTTSSILAFSLLSHTWALRVPSLLNVPSFPYGLQKVRGVNVGGWLLLEPFITPSLFDNTGDNSLVDEYTYGEYASAHPEAKDALKNHWDTFITEEDFAQIAAAGLNHVRIPIGYWAFKPLPEAPFISGQLPYLRKAVGWARNHGLKVIVDLHGAPGSQNGFDNSGQKMDSPQWQSKQSNIDLTEEVVKMIVQEFGGDSTVPTIAPLNEPAGYRGADLLNATRQYWLDTYDIIRYPDGKGLFASESNTLVLIHDAFQGVGYWNGFMPSPEYQNYGLDKHIYQIFSDDENRRDDTEHLRVACNYASELTSAQDFLVVVGEWSTASTDCARYLNSRGVGSRYDGTYPGSSKIGSCEGKTGPASSIDKEYQEFMRKYWEAQVITYEKAGGWLQWTWKTESAAEWSYKAGLEAGWIPQDPTDLKYPDICDQFQ
ncbi:hypothetical protein AAF712_004336 [Marasmius tenuissimus]|uniref:Glycoside hydrolase family 5 domain-containing protein n=1 Tax=Marasmius tenuissimus TaxID=585030 RepID=A0ABR3A4Z1_9AGAR|nr:hypothetical protein PM082_003288 [Marasmius tenuissimus]